MLFGGVITHVGDICHGDVVHEGVRLVDTPAWRGKQEHNHTRHVVGVDTPGSNKNKENQSKEQKRNNETKQTQGKKQNARSHITSWSSHTWTNKMHEWTKKKTRTKRVDKRLCGVDTPGLNKYNHE